jgi:UDP-glucose 4-epimerase
MPRAAEQTQTKRIVMTGLAGRMGRLVARRLHRLGLYQVVGIDRRPVVDLPKDVEHLQVDIRSRRARDVFRAGPVDAFIHLGLMHDPRKSRDELHSWNVVGTSRLLEYCADYQVRKVVFLSTATIYGPRADNAQFLTEESPLLASQDFPAIRDQIEADMQATAFFWQTRGKDVETVVLRPVHILGKVNNAASTYLRLPHVPVIMGFDPMVQVIHEDDVARAVVACLRPGAHGVMNLTGPGEAPLSVLIRELGKTPIPVPKLLIQPVLNTLWRFRLTNFPVPELAHLEYICMVDGSRARRELGFRPRYSIKETVRAVLGEDTD